MEFGASYQSGWAGAPSEVAGRIRYLALSAPPAEDDPNFPEARAKFRLVLHHTLGGVYRLPALVTLERAREMVALCTPPWIVESVDCSTTWDGAWNLGSRFQPLYTEEFLDHYVRNVTMLMREIPVALAVQNVPSYLPGAGWSGEPPVRRAQMREGEFLRRLAERSGCRISLNVPAACISAAVHGMEPLEYLSEFPLNRVIEMQLGVVGPAAGPDPVATPDREQTLTLARTLWERTTHLQAVFLEYEPEPPRQGMDPYGPEKAAMPHPGWTDLRIQDLLIRSIADSGFRHDPENSGKPFFDPRQLDMAARLFARRYYLAALRRHYRYTTALEPLTGRAPDRVLLGEEIVPLLENSVLGSRVSSERIAGRVRSCLTESDEAITARVRYWRDLVRYDEAAFLVASSRTQSGEGPNPRMHPAALLIDLEHDLEPVLPEISPERIPAAAERRVSMIFCNDGKGHVTAARASEPARRILEAADGTLSLQALAHMAGLATPRAEALAQTLRKIGALV